MRKKHKDTRLVFLSWMLLPLLGSLRVCQHVDSTLFIFEFLHTFSKCTASFWTVLTGIWERELHHKIHHVYIWSQKYNLSQILISLLCSILVYGLFWKCDYSVTLLAKTTNSSPLACCPALDGCSAARLVCDGGATRSDDVGSQTAGVWFRGKFADVLTRG